MAEVIKGSEVAAHLKNRLKKIVDDECLTPRLGIVRVGHNDSDLAYERGIVKTCADTGIEVNIFEIPENISRMDFNDRLRDINNDDSLNGILLFRPLPDGLDADEAAEIISADKDMDCMCSENWAKLVMGRKDGYYPCTAESVIKICDFANVKYDGAKAVVIGRSQVIGKPVALMLLSKNATVTWCHSHTKDLADELKGANIIVSACGVAELIGSEMVSGISNDCIAIDVGINFKGNKMCGDFNFEQVSNHASKITPVPGGVGAVTNTVLASHVVRAAYKLKKGTDIII